MGLPTSNYGPDRSGTGRCSEIGTSRVSCPVNDVILCSVAIAYYQLRFQEDDSDDVYNFGNGDILSNEEASEEDAEEEESEESEIAEQAVEENEAEDDEDDYIFNSDESEEEEEYERSEDGELIHLIVGEEGQYEFFLSEHRLIRESKFFRNALTGGYLETGEKKIRLEHEEPIIFEPEMFFYFEHWLNNQCLPCPNRGHDNLFDSWATAQGIDPYRYRLANPNNLIDMYLLADKYDIKKLRNECVSDLLYNIEERLNMDLPSNEWIHKAFEYLPVRSSLCKLLTDIYCKYNTKNEVFEGITSPEALRAFCFVWTELTAYDGVNPRDNLLSICDYRED